MHRYANEPPTRDKYSIVPPPPFSKQWTAPTAPPTTLSQMTYFVPLLISRKHPAILAFLSDSFGAHCVRDRYLLAGFFSTRRSWAFLSETSTEASQDDVFRSGTRSRSLFVSDK